MREDIYSLATILIIELLIKGAILGQKKIYIDYTNNFNYNSSSNPYSVSSKYDSILDLAKKETQIIKLKVDQYVEELKKIEGISEGEIGALIKVFKGLPENEINKIINRLKEEKKLK